MLLSAFPRFYQVLIGHSHSHLVFSLCSMLRDFSIAILDFPSCVIGDQPELTAESLEIGTNLPYCWRNLFSCVNLLRILNKLTKWKHSRIMVLRNHHIFWPLAIFRIMMAL